MRTAITLGLIGLASAVSISIKDQGSAVTPCDPANQDCSCADKSYNQCIEPNAAVSVHTNNLEECILNCELFNTFGQCDWLIFYNSGPDENCRLFAQGETMEEYLFSCNMVGQPLRYPAAAPAAGTCMTEYSAICTGGLQGVYCPGSPPCKACDSSDLCNVNYHQAQCTMKVPPTEFAVDNISYDGCQAACTAQSVADAFTYFTWDKSGEVCDCFNGGTRQCDLEVVKFGFSMSDITECKSGIVNGACTSDSDCAGVLLCDLTGDPVCAAGCRQHTDCGDDEYCTCKSCPDPGMIGQCKTGCRDLADPCSPPVGGTCNDNHVCTAEGTPKLRSIGLKTTSCTGCTAEGARLEIFLIQSPSTSCTTGVLDNPGVPDYNPGGAEANFSEDLLDECELIDSFGAGTVKVSWEGAGSWTPEVVNIYWSASLAYNCRNTNNLEVSTGSSITLACKFTP